MHLNLHLLRTFFAVASERSFSRAADKLFVSQPAVSKAVRELERQLGLPLLERSGAGSREACLTEGGAALFEHARGIFALERAAMEEVQARLQERRGRLTIGASTTIAGYWLSPYLAAMLQEAPEIDLQVRVGNTAAIERAIVDCEIDVALVEGPVGDARLDSFHWQDDLMCLATSAQSSLARNRRPTAAVLSEQTWLIREPGSGTREVAQRFMNTYEINPVRTFEIWSNEGIARAVAKGIGIAILPLCVVHELQTIGAIKLLRLGRDSPILRPLYRVELRGRPKSPLLRKFCETLEKHAATPAARLPKQIR